ncbi:MAG TPA: 2Fe-2S iron-sulfur cluster-binding protein [Planctomycetota bacterium]|nr:2Fe-2S iron-sulfur cluster-binding protein [Planctomycetota bacterium]
MPNLHFVNWNKSVRVGALANLRRAALLAGVPLYNGLAKLTNCRGAGFCGTCRVKVEPGEQLTPPTIREKVHGCTGPYRLACQARVADNDGDLRITKMRGFLGKSAFPVPGPGIADRSYQPPARGPGPVGAAPAR